MQSHNLKSLLKFVKKEHELYVDQNHIEDGKEWVLLVDGWTLFVAKESSKSLKQEDLEPLKKCFKKLAGVAW